ncbi:hypothetical protein SGLAM104S_01629 [Streptomyces glaucescens]
MALRYCTGCTTRFAVGLPRCPWCGSREHVEDGEDMAKITVHGGPSNATAEQQAAPAAPEGSEESSASNSSETSNEKPTSSPETSSSATRKRARTTANRSARARTETSTARGTAGDQADVESATGSTSEAAG